MPPDPLWFRLLAGLLIGLSLGSFVTMLSYRAPRRLSIMEPPSHCTKCRTPLKPRDLVPVFSWVVQGGKCRHCGVPVSARYVMIELVTAALSVAAFAWFGFHPKVLLALVAIVALVTLVTINVERSKK